MGTTRGNRGLQYLATLAANMGAFASGTGLSYPAVAVPSLRRDDYFKTIMTEGDESWIECMFALGVVVSCPVAGILVQKLGRRMTMLVISFPYFLSWIIINVANSITMILVGRFMTGFFAGIFLLAGPLFTAEIVDASIRGAIGATFDMSSSAGILFIYVIGTYVSWRGQALVCAMCPIVIFVLMLAVPESPAFLLKVGKTEATKKALKRYKAGGDDPERIVAVFNEMQHEVIKSKASEDAKLSDLLARPILIPASLALMIFTLQVLSAVDPILVHLVDIFKNTGGAGRLNEYVSTIIFGVIQLVAGLFATILVDRTGRRFLLILSEAMIAITLAALGVFFFARNGISPTLALHPLPPPSSGRSSSYAWLPLTSLSIYILAYCVGLGPVGYLLLGEILPFRVKGLVGCFITLVKWLLSFLLTKFFDDIILGLGDAGTFWLFSGIAIAGLISIYFFLPETKGRSLEDIQRMFRKIHGSSKSTDDVHSSMGTTVLTGDWDGSAGGDASTITEGTSMSTLTTMTATTATTTTKSTI